MESIQIKPDLMIRGKQRIATYNAINHPSTGRQILERCHEQAPSMTYQDLRHILRDFQQQGICICLNPEQQTGRLYAINSEQNVQSLTSSELRLCTLLSRGKTRRAVLKEIDHDRLDDTKPLTATHIKKRLRSTYPLGLNHVLSALKFLESHQLVEAVDTTAKRDLKIYQITSLGKDILSHLYPKTHRVQRD